MNKKLFTHNFSLLHADHVLLNEKWNYTNVISPYHRIYYIDKGEGFILTEHGKIKLEPGYLYMIPSFTLCHLLCTGHLSQYFLHFFEDQAESVSVFEKGRMARKVPAGDRDIENFKRIVQINPGRGINRSDDPAIYEKNAYYKTYQELNKEVSESVYFETQGIMLQLISRFLSLHPVKATEPDPVPPKILDTIRHIQLNLKENLTITYLAARLNLNEDYFSRLFLSVTGQRPLSYLHEKRIERAQYLIATTQLSFTEIAEMTGFENLPYFSKIFKKITTITPGRYKKLNRLI